MILISDAVARLHTSDSKLLSLLSLLVNSCSTAE